MTTPTQGQQRLSVEKLNAWEALGYGMFIHFGMSTYDGDELSKGDRPATTYAPDQLDVDQWVRVAREAGMKYAVLTAKHVAGFCLWPTKLTDYHVGRSGNHTDVVEAFVNACDRHGIAPGLYYCSWDNHHLFGSATPSFTRWENAFTTTEYRDFQMAQVEELLTQYGPLREVWIDVPHLLGHDGRRKQYDQIVRLQPEAVIMMNGGIADGSRLNYNSAWPTDLMAIERYLPNSLEGYNPWHRISHGGVYAPTRDPGRFEYKTAGSMSRLEYKPVEADYYLPGEVCDPIGQEWFWVPNDLPRSDAELLGMRLICRERHASLLLDVPPDTNGLIPKHYADALMRLRKNMEQVAG